MRWCLRVLATILRFYWALIDPVSTQFTHNFIVYCGTTFSEVFVWSENDALVNLTGWEAQMQMRSPTATYSILSSDGQINLGVTGEISLTLDSHTTTSMLPGTYVWDLLLKNSDGEIQPPMVSGVATVLQGITVWQ